MSWCPDVQRVYLKLYLQLFNYCFVVYGAAIVVVVRTQTVCLCVSQRVMDEAYKLIAHTYLKHLVRSSQKKLRKCWSPNVVQKVIEDTELLHNTISELVGQTFWY